MADQSLVRQLASSAGRVMAEAVGLSGGGRFSGPAGYDRDRYRSAVANVASRGAVAASEGFGLYGQPGFGGGAGSGEVGVYRRWRNLWTSPRQSVMTDLSYLITQSRYLARYHPQVQNLVRTIVEWTISKGLNHKITTTGMSKRAAENLIAAVKNDLETRRIDSEGMLHVWAMDRLIEGRIIIDGSLIVLMRRLTMAQGRKRGLKIPMMVEMYGQDMIALGIRPNDLKDGEEFRDGYKVEVASKRRIGLYMWDKHPNESGTRTYKCLPIFDSQGHQQLFHYFDTDQSGQLTGTPRAVTVVDLAHNTADYRMSILDRLREDSKTTKYFKPASTLAFRPIMGSEGPLGNGNMSASANAPTEITGEITWDQMCAISEELGAQMLDNNTSPVLPPGWDVKEGQMTPANDFPNFYMTLLRDIATGMGVPYNLGANDQKGGSFSADKISLSTFKSECESRQRARITGWRADLWDCWYRSGESVPVADGGWAGESARGKWEVYANAFPVLEPENEANASAILLDKGLTSWSVEVTRRGFDPDELEESIVKDAKRKGFASIGVALKPLGYLAKGGTDPNAVQGAQGGNSTEAQA